MIPCHPKDVAAFESLNALYTRLTDAEPAVLQICAWCPEFEPLHPRNKGANHILCAVCSAKLEAEAQ